MLPKKALITSLVILMLAVPLVAQADDDPLVTVSTSVSCNQVDFSIDINGGTGTYNVDVEYGDGQSDSFEGVPPIFPFTHSYTLGDSYEWVVNVTDVGDDFEYEEVGTEQIGPVVDLTSVPFPPLVILMGGEASITFTASVSGGSGSYTDFSWDLDGDGVDDGLSGDEVRYIYTEGGGYTASVSVTDSCPGELTVFVIDPDEEPVQACHPTALKIANAVSELAAFTQLTRAEQLYSCEDILNIFNTGTDTYDGHVGFGRLWHAYQLTEVIPLLTWEEIRDWQLDGGFGWGSLLQLNRFADALGEDIVITDLVVSVLEGENSIKDIRTAVRSFTRYEADFNDVLTRLADGANSGELNQFYRLAQDFGVEAAELDEYMTAGEGMSLAELRQAAKLAERMNIELSEIASVGVAEFRSLQREIERTERETARDERTAERIAERLAEQFEGAVTADAMAYFEECEGKWGCVRKKMREQEQAQTQDTSSQETSRAAQIADQYGVPQEEVMQKYADCGSDWSCVRSYYRDINKTNQGKGKGKNK